jgi:hypothetical protein
MSLTTRLLTAALLLASACASRGVITPATPEVLETPLPGDPVVTLLDPGAEPRARLRYKLGQGPQPPMVMDVEMTMAVGLGGATPPPSKIPLTRMTFAFDVSKVEPSGATVAGKIASCEVLPGPQDRPAVVEAIKKGMAGMVGTEMAMKVTPRGFVREAKVTLPPSTPPEMRAMMDSFQNIYQQATVSFPAEPVGPGARWRVLTAVDSGPVKMQQTALVTLEGRDDRGARLSISAEQTAPPQPLKAPGLPPGASVSLDSYSGQGQGRTQVRLDSVTPEASMNLKTKMASTVVVNETRSQMNMSMDLVMKVGAGSKP